MRFLGWQIGLLVWNVAVCDGIDSTDSHSTQDPSSSSEVPYYSRELSEEYNYNNNNNNGNLNDLNQFNLKRNTFTWTNYGSYYGQPTRKEQTSNRRYDNNDDMDQLSLELGSVSLDDKIHEDILNTKTFDLTNFSFTSNNVLSPKDRSREKNRSPSPTRFKSYSSKTNEGLNTNNESLFPTFNIGHHAKEHNDHVFKATKNPKLNFLESDESDKSDNVGDSDSDTEGGRNLRRGHKNVSSPQRNNKEKKNHKKQRESTPFPKKNSSVDKDDSSLEELGDLMEDFNFTQSSSTHKTAFDKQFTIDTKNNTNYNSKSWHPGSSHKAPSSRKRNGILSRDLIKVKGCNSSTSIKHKGILKNGFSNDDKKRKDIPRFNNGNADSMDPPNRPQKRVHFLDREGEDDDRQNDGQFVPYFKDRSSKK